MDLIDFYRLEQKRVHSWMRQSISDLTPEEWNQTIEGTGNNIAFLVWHCVRTEDNILRFILRKQPTIWGDGHWHERLGLPPRVQGTGIIQAIGQVCISHLFIHLGEVALLLGSMGKQGLPL